ncbi:MAG: diguanylate cyclase [Pseudomonadota bacterium]
MNQALRWIRARLLDRRDATSCLLFAFLTLPMLVLLWGLHTVALFRPEVAALYRVDVLWFGQILLMTLMLWLSGVAVYCWRRRHAMRIPAWVALWTVTPTLLVFVLLSVAYGLKDSLMPMVLLEEIILARALFKQRVLTTGLVLGGLMIVVSEGLLLARSVPYAPLLVHPIFNGQPMHWWWAIMLRVVFDASVLPCAAMLFFFFETLHRQRKELESLVRTDVLTGLANRREFMAQLEAESHRQIRDGRPFCVVLCDVDHFKRVNDTWGHPVGDAVLEQLGQILTASTRPQIDVAARLGGEEFGLILPDTDSAGAERVAQKMADALRASLFTGDGEPFVVTQSVGIAQVVDGQGALALRVADQNLYKAKHSGRDCVVASRLMPITTSINESRTPSARHY